MGKILIGVIGVLGFISIIFILCACKVAAWSDEISTRLKK